MSRHRRVRVLRVIARMVGGPAFHVSLLSGRLDPDRYDTLLVAGRPGPGEGSLDDLAERYGARLLRMPTLGPELGPSRDLKAVGALARVMRRLQPDIVHTHTAKAGALGRTAALLALRPRPILVHTFHGHVLTGYFGSAASGAYRRVERALASRTDRLVAVSAPTAEELAALGVAPRSKIDVIRIGLELDGFLRIDRSAGQTFREELGASQDELVALFAGRLAPIKRLDVLLDGVAHARRQGAPVRLAVVGEGLLRPELESRASALGLTDAIHFLGYRRGLERMAAGSDVAVLSSDNEGTPVALIEAAAAAVPLLATDVGGVREIVTEDTGVLVPPGDPEAFGDALAQLAADPERRRAAGARAREHVRGRFDARRLIGDVDALYTELLAKRRGGHT